MEIGFIGLGSMGGPMSRRLVEAGHKLTVFDTRKEAMEPLIKLGAEAARSPADVADRVETVLTSLPSLDIGMKVVTGDDGLIRGNRVRRYVELEMNRPNLIETATIGTLLHTDRLAAFAKMKTAKMKRAASVPGSKLLHGQLTNTTPSLTVICAG